MEESVVRRLGLIERMGNNGIAKRVYEGKSVGSH